ncbi:limbic system-associated membrane protein-like isoform X2 [Biomphalaria glabrata]|uniref:Limbic system-associated membrane protein-like isoform X2 n=1 Tax=Biomphalaria glabrata TaxID=6526 RepID=A0A9W3ASV6_BIOGL|nr:limbic system-associated membrane protein-like isoform X2 [Biomphalaria glabrata]
MRDNRRRMGVWTEFISLFFMLYIIDLTELMTLEPSFDTPMANVTVKEMATAILPCSVKFIGKHQVVWTDQLSTLLTFEDRRIIDDERLSVERPFIKDWNLHIREVKHKDQGLYNCQINTNPVKIKTVYLRVQVPAKILNNASTDAIIAREGATVTIVCNASGIPPPTITWHRISRSDKVEDKKTIGSTGEILIIYNVSRHCGGIYECVASNDVPPAVNKLIRVNVEFPPEIYLPNSELGHDVGKETVLECSITANPQATAYWKRNGTELKTTSGKFRIEPYTDDGAQTMILSLRIMVIDKEDFGIYSCEASNKLGSAAEQMTFYELSERRRQLFGTTTVTTTPRMTTAVTVRRVETLPPKHHHLVYPDPHASSNVVKDKHQTYGQHNGKKTDFSNSRSDSGCSDVAPVGIHYVIATVVCLVLHTVSLRGSHYSPPQHS